MKRISEVVQEFKELLDEYGSLEVSTIGDSGYIAFDESTNKLIYLNIFVSISGTGSKKP